jgi:hypothetical protein
MPSEDFERFRWSCFDRSFGAGHDGLDVDALLRLTGDERTQAEALVLDVIASGSADERAIQAAGWLRLNAAAPYLKHRVEAEPDAIWSSTRIDIAVALHRIEQYPRAAGILIEELNRRNDPWYRSFPGRMHIAYALREVGPTAPVLKAVMEKMISETQEYVRRMRLVDPDDAAARVPQTPRGIALAEVRSSLRTLSDLLEDLATAPGGRQALITLRASHPHELQRSLQECFLEGSSSDLATPLGLLHAETASRFLHERLSTATGRDRVRIALALYRIERFPEAERMILDVIRQSGLEFQQDRREALHVLPNFALDAPIADALLGVIAADEDEWVARDSLQALRRMCPTNERARMLLAEIEGTPPSPRWVRPSAEQLALLRHILEV